MTEQSFRVAGPDTRVIGVTLIFVALFLWFAIPAVVALGAGQVPSPGDLVIGLLLLGLIASRFALAVRRYRLVRQDDGSTILWIDRMLPVRRRGVPLARLLSVRARPDLPPILNSGLFGMGGLFGWAGAAMVRNMGNVDAYGTNNRHSVILEFMAKPGQESPVPGKRGPIYIVTPADPPAFVNAVQVIQGSAPRPGLFQVADLPAPPATAPPPRTPTPATRNRRKR